MKFITKLFKRNPERVALGMLQQNVDIFSALDDYARTLDKKGPVKKEEAYKLIKTINNTMTKYQQKYLYPVVKDMH